MSKKLTRIDTSVKSNPFQIDPQAMVVEAAVGIVKEIIIAGADYLKCREHEITERRRIAAMLEAKLTELNLKGKELHESNCMLHEEAMKMYSIFEKLLESPQISENPDLQKTVLQYLVAHHNGSIDRFNQKVNAINSIF